MSALAGVLDACGGMTCAVRVAVEKNAKNPKAKRVLIFVSPFQAADRLAPGQVKGKDFVGFFQGLFKDSELPWVKRAGREGVFPQYPVRG